MAFFSEAHFAINGMIYDSKQFSELSRGGKLGI